MDGSAIAIPPRPAPSPTPSPGMPGEAGGSPRFSTRAAASPDPTIDVLRDSAKDPEEPTFSIPSPTPAAVIPNVQQITANEHSTRYGNVPRARDDGRGAGSGWRAASRARLPLVSLVALLLFSALAGRLAYLVNPFDSDAAIFISMAKMTVEGGRLTHDLVDNKLPTVGLILTPAWRAFGASWPAYVLLGTTLSLATSLVLGAAARRTWGPGAGTAAFLFSLAYLNFNTAVFGGFQLETPQVFFSALAAFFFLTALRHDRPSATFAAALAAACAAYFKPSGLAVASAFTVVVVLQYVRLPRRLAVHLAAVTVGVALGFVPAACYLTAADLWRDMPPLLDQIGTYARESAWGPTDLAKIPIVLVILGFPLAVRGWVFRRDALTPSSRRRLRFVALWFALELAAIILQRRMYAYHFLPLVPPAALLFASLPRRSGVPSLAAALLPISLASLLGAAAVVQLTYSGRPTHPVSDYLRAHADPNDTLWSQDDSRLLLETNLRSGSRFQQTFLFANYDRAPLDYGQLILADLESRSTTWVILRTDFDAWVVHQSHAVWELDQRPIRRANYIATWNGIRNYVQSHYAPVAQVGRQTVYRRHASVQPAPAETGF